MRVGQFDERHFQRGKTSQDHGFVQIAQVAGPEALTLQKGESPGDRDPRRLARVASQTIGIEGGCGPVRGYRDGSLARNNGIERKGPTYAPDRHRAVDRARQARMTAM